MTKAIPNEAAAGISYYTPAQDPPAGTAVDKNAPKLFQPLQIRGLKMQNRIMVSPMCQYSAPDGHHTMWHWTHLGGIVQRGPGLTTVEATAVLSEGRITPEDSGLWKDSQIEPLRRSVEFAHSQSQKIGIQLAHAGRKASTVAPWLSSGDIAVKEVNGWPDDVWGPSPISYNDNHPPTREMSLEKIEEFKQAFVASIKRALTAGFDFIEIHGAHGYLLFEFLSPTSNKRTDKYGGSFENRTRLICEVVQLARETIPKDMPLFFRISGTEWLEESLPKEESWTVEDTVRLAKILADLGVDVLDVSSGGNDPRQHPHVEPGYQAPLAKAVKKELGDKLIVATVGSITEAKLAQKLLDDGLDIVVAGRAFQKNPGLVWAWADELGVEIYQANQIRWGFAGRGSKSKK